MRCVFLFDSLSVWREEEKEEGIQTHANMC